MTQRSSPTIVDAAISEDGAIVTTTWSDGASSRYHSEWLRDGCSDESSRHVNGQRVFDLFEGRDAVTVMAATPAIGGGLRVVFSPNDHESVFDARWLRANQYDRMPHLPRGWANPELRCWAAGDTIKSHQYDAVSSDDGARLKWLQDQRLNGVTLLTGCPTQPDTVIELAELFGFVRETNYGRLFDVKSVADPINLAFTADGLKPHSDNPYRDPVPGLQLLHCIEAAGTGGESQVVDGLAAAIHLRDTDPDAFDVLTRWPLRFEFKAADAVLQAEAPMIELSANGEITTVRFNDRSSQVPRLPFDVVTDFYAGYRKFSELIYGGDFTIEFKLEAGDMFMVNNRRVLHGRNGYKVESGTRHLQGCYADLDTMLSTIELLK